jgi:hypothetical protein
MLTERTLRNWRVEALRVKVNSESLIKHSPEGVNTDVLYQREMAERILRLTQELLDQHLMKGK